MNSYIDYSSNQIINIIIDHFIPYSGLVTDAKFSKDEIISDIKNIGYIKIEAYNDKQSDKQSDKKINEKNDKKNDEKNNEKNNEKNDEKNITVFLVLNINGKYSHSPELRKLLDSITNEYKTSLYELILIADEIFFTKKTLLDIIKEYQKGKKNIEFRQPLYNAYPYHNFVINIPASESVPIHRIMSQEEIEQNITSEYLKISDLPIIYSNDPPIVWLRGREGQVVEIQRKSATSGIAITYRRIEKKI